jgi:hypothetical protein
LRKPLIPLLGLLCFFYFQSFVWSVDAPSPTSLPHVKPHMRSAGFWISLHPSPDKVIFNPEEIKTFNSRNRDQLKLTKDIFSLVNHFQTESLLDVFQNAINSFSSGYYLANDSREDASFMEKVKKNMHLNGIVLGVEPRYGLIVSYANQRFLPTTEGLYAKKGDIDFDELQNSGLDIGTPVAVVHQSTDGKWYYVLSALSDGWIESDKIVLGDTQQIKNYMETKDFVVIISPKADIFLDSAMTKFHAHDRMGIKLPLLEENDNQYGIQIPIKDNAGHMQLTKGYIAKGQAHRGYLPYTARTIYNQAFLMLDKPYGWGDVNEEQDCSRFLQMVYGTVGIELPRNSSAQAQVGTDNVSFDEKTGVKERLDHLQGVQGATTILPLRGHIMLYLGMVDGIPFAIHETSGYSQTQGDQEIKRVLNRVVVSDLSLGESSRKGSLLRRLTKVVSIP